MVQVKTVLSFYGTGMTGSSVYQKINVTLLEFLKQKEEVHSPTAVPMVMITGFKMPN